MGSRASADRVKRLRLDGMGKAGEPPRIVDEDPGALRVSDAVPGLLRASAGMGESLTADPAVGPAGDQAAGKLAAFAARTCRLPAEPVRTEPPAETNACAVL